MDLSRWNKELRDKTDEESLIGIGWVLAPQGPW